MTVNSPERAARLALARNLAARLARMADEGRDELAVIDGFVSRLEVGFNNYGPLDLAQVKARLDLDAEADQEIADWAVYKALKRHSERTPVVMTGVVQFDLSDIEDAP